MEFKEEMLVEDLLYPIWGIGVVTKILENKLHVFFSNIGKVVYDKENFKFLNIIE